MGGEEGWIEVYGLEVRMLGKALSSVRRGVLPYCRNAALLSVSFSPFSSP